MHHQCPLGWLVVPDLKGSTSHLRCQWWTGGIILTGTARRFCRVSTLKPSNSTATSHLPLFRVI